MLNDRKDDYEGSEDSEYHFSDEEVSYEADAGSAKKATAGFSGAMETAGKSKKVLISFGVFVALIFVVYKMVAPGSSTPTTDIAPQAAAPASPMSATPQVASAPVAAAPSMPVATQPASANPPSALQQMAATQDVQQTQQAMQAQQALQQAQLSAQQAMQNMNSAQQAAPAQPVQDAAQAAQSPQAVAQQGTSQIQQAMSQTQQAMAQMQQAMTQPKQAPQAEAQQQDSNAQPPAMPAQSGQSAVNQTAPIAPPASAMRPQTQITDPGAAALAIENARLTNQLQAEYTQRMADYQTQNKNLQTQVEALSGRVATMETEMSQLIQTLTQQFQGGSVPAAGVANMQPNAAQGVPVAQAPAAAVAAPEQAGPPPKVPYSVQAIIPGRAWLRSNNGDTVTVAEGDDIKGVGRVTKIDPYDGVVEINVQGRSVSLSYGNGT
jgi:hypothetical protein